MLTGSPFSVGVTIMNIINLDERGRKALAIWDEYKKQHDLSNQTGQVVGIDPDTGGVWIGPTSDDVLARAREVNPAVVPMLLRVGYDYYWRKQGRRP
jgi:hypothetical protein